MMIESIFSRDSKIQGNAQLALRQAPANPAGLFPWQDVWDTPELAFAETLLEVDTADRHPHMMTVSLGLAGRALPTAPGIGAIATEVVGLMNIGVGGGMIIQAQVDFVQGVQFSLSCAHMQLMALHRVVPGNQPALPTPLPIYPVAASVSGGAVAHGRQPQRTIAFSWDGLTGLAPAATHYWFIPAFAKSFRVAALPNNANLLLQEWNSNLGAAATFPVIAAPSVDIPVVTDARFLAITNNSIFAVTDYRIIFELAL